MAVRVSLNDVVLSASEACCSLYVERGTADLTVAEICAATGLSQRSFYRYFPVKADSVQPVLDWTTATFNSHVATASEAPTRTILREGFRRMLGGQHAERTRMLTRIMVADPELWSVFLRAVHFGEVSLIPALADRLRLPADSARARVAAAAVAAATRLALEDLVGSDIDPEEPFMAFIDAFGSGLFDT